ncbi:MAG: hypothetical protein WCI27_11625, partial [Candidatus Omnitrophota bacterium]
RFKTGISRDVAQRLERGDVISRLFIQDKSRPRPLEEEILFLYALRQKILDVVSWPEVERFKHDILRFAGDHYPVMVDALIRQKKLTPEITKGLDECLVAFFKSK